jgi:hypothetical protein
MTMIDGSNVSAGADLGDRGMADLNGALGNDEGGNEPEGKTPDPQTPAGQAPNPNEPDPLDKLLDSWENGTHEDSTGKIDTQNPLAGLDANHPLVKYAQQATKEQQFRQATGEVVQELLNSGVPREVIPQFVQMLGALKEVAGQNQEMRTLLDKVDNSEMVKAANARKIAKTYGKYGVTEEMLMVGAKNKDYDAKQMENLARTLAVITRKNGSKTRVENKSDRFERPSAGQAGAGKSILDLREDNGLDLIRGALK